MNLGDLLMGTDPALGTFQTEQQQRVWESLLPLLQRLGASGTATSRNDPYMRNFNQGLNPIYGRSYNTNRYNLPTQRVPYPTGSRTSQASRDRILANINKNRLLNNQTPITLDRYSNFR